MNDNEIKSVFVQTYWPVAGVDLSLLAAAGLAVMAARRLGLREQSAARRDGVATAGARRINPAQAAGQVPHG